MDSGKDCVDLLSKLLDQFGSRINYVLVQNQIRDDNFNILEFSGVKIGTGFECPSYYPKASSCAGNDQD